jgi:hypothetical protein
MLRCCWVCNHEKCHSMIAIEVVERIRELNRLETASRDLEETTIHGVTPMTTKRKSKISQQ